MSSREWCVKATIRTQSNISHNQLSKYAVKNGSNVISVTESPQCFSRTTWQSRHGDCHPCTCGADRSVQLRPAFVLSFAHWLSGYVLVIFFVNIGVVQFNSFKWKLDLVFEVIVHTKWNLWLLFPFPHIVSFFRGSQRGILKYDLDNIMNIMKGMGNGSVKLQKRQKNSEKCDLCTISSLLKLER